MDEGDNSLTDAWWTPLIAFPIIALIVVTLVFGVQKAWPVLGLKNPDTNITSVGTVASLRDIPASPGVLGGNSEIYQVCAAVSDGVACGYVGQSAWPTYHLGDRVRVTYVCGGILSCRSTADNPAYASAIEH